MEERELMAKAGKPFYKVAKYDRARDCTCECGCTDPVTVSIAVSNQALAKLKKETPDIRIVSD